MNNHDILEVPRLPARLDAGQAARYLGFAEHDIPVLVASKLLRVLGSPVQNSRKYFSSFELTELAKDRTWLDKATKAVAQHWRDKNEDRSEKIPP